MLTPYTATALAKWYGTNFRLIYRCSREELGLFLFHARCDNQGATVTLIKSDGGAMFGGYLGESWNSTGNYINDPTASIFTLTNNLGIAPTKFEVRSAANAGYGHSSYGPTFGGHDIHVACHNGISVNFGANYIDTTGRGNAVFHGGVAMEVEVYARYEV